MSQLIENTCIISLFEAMFVDSFIHVLLFSFIHLKFYISAQSILFTYLTCEYLTAHYNKFSLLY